ncbi:MAG: Ig-like domain-containing protein [Candidatus Krumholzibacteriales bacterium]
MKKRIFYLISILSLVTLYACSDNESDTPEAPETDSDPPGISATFPADSAADVTRSGPFWVLFDEEMNHNSAEDSCTFIPEVGTVSYSNYWSGDTMFFAPDEILAGGTSHLITIGAGSRDIAGNRMGTPYELFFTTTSDEDTDPPYVVSTDPANGATGVTPSTDIEIIFSEPIKVSSYDWDTQTFFAIIPDYPAEGNIRTEGNKLILDGVQLAQDTQIQISIMEITDLAGNPMVPMYTFSFETAADNTRPYLIGSVPANGAQGVSTPISGIELAFSEPMNTDLEPDSVDARVMNAVMASGSEPVWNPTDSLMQVPLYSGVIGSGATYWVYFGNSATDKAGNIIDPNPTYYRFTTSGAVDYYPIVENLPWHFKCTDSIPAYWYTNRHIDNYDPSDGSFDLITMDINMIADTSDVWHMRKTGSSLWFISRKEYEDGVYRETWTWDSPIEYIRLPMEDHLGESWNFATTFNAGGETADISGTITMGDQLITMPGEGYISRGIFMDCISHRLEVDISAGEMNMSLVERKWFAPAFGCFKSISEEAGRDTTSCELLYWGPDME